MYCICITIHKIDYYKITKNHFSLYIIIFILNYLTLLINFWMSIKLFYSQISLSIISLINNTIHLKQIIFRRRPAWTDRILYKTIDPLNKKYVLDVLSYKDIESIKLSDHRPVYGESCIQVIIVTHCYFNFVI